MTHTTDQKKRNLATKILAGQGKIPRENFLHVVLPGGWLGAGETAHRTTPPTAPPSSLGTSSASRSLPTMSPVWWVWENLKNRINLPKGGRWWVRRCWWTACWSQGFLLIKHCAFEEIFGFVNFAGLRRRDWGRLFPGGHWTNLLCWTLDWMQRHLRRWN